MPETYTGIVTTIDDPELGSNGKEKPRKVVLKQDLSEQYGKTFRMWSWHDDFPNLQMGKQVTVDFTVQPNPDPSRKGSNMIDAAWLSEGGAKEVAVTPSNETPPTGTAPPSGDVGDDPWGDAPDLNPANQQTATPSTPVATNGNAAYATTKDDYWQKRDIQDEERQKQIVASWGITNAIKLAEVRQASTKPADIREIAHQLIVLKQQIASEL